MTTQPSPLLCKSCCTKPAGVNTPTGVVIQRCLQSSHTPDSSSKAQACCVLVQCCCLLNLSLMAGKSVCPCCPNTEEPKAVPLSTATLATTLAPADQLWSTSRDKAVRLRMEGSGQASETPITIHQMFLQTVEKYGDHPALVSKHEGQWVTLTWRQYYEQCRAAAKSFLKVCLQINLFCIYCYIKDCTNVSLKYGAIRKYLGSGFYCSVVCTSAH